jgi:hypothetical protein
MDYNKWLLFMSQFLDGPGRREAAGEGIVEITTKQKPSAVFAGRDNAKFTAMSALPQKRTLNGTHRTSALCQ